MPFFWGLTVCEEAKDLVRKLLRRDPDRRIDVEDALDHPWLRKSSTPEHHFNGRTGTDPCQPDKNNNAPDTGCTLS
jgi:serine/threonine protein kinase